MNLGPQVYKNTLAKRFDPSSGSIPERSTNQIAALVQNAHDWQRKYYDVRDKLVFWRLVSWGLTCVCFIIAIIK